MADVTKSFKSKYDKRVQLEDGTTIPVVLDEVGERFSDAAAEE